MASSFPFLAIAARFRVDYGIVANYAEAVRRSKPRDAEDRHALALCWPAAAKATEDAVDSESSRRNVIENHDARLV